MVNVKDVAEAHIQAFEIPSASGRYCMVERVVHYSELVKILKELYPDFQVPENSQRTPNPIGKNRIREERKVLRESKDEEVIRSREKESETTIRIYTEWHQRFQLRHSSQETSCKKGCFSVVC